jgi:uncharacterized protein (TIGR03435 family)
MRREIICLAIAVFSAAAQNPSFEVASVKPAAAATGAFKGEPEGTVSIIGGTVNMRNVTLRDMILAAYGIKDHQLSGPGSLKSGRYDVVAKASGPAGGEQIQAMLQGLLAERFQLAVHRETKEMSRTELVVAKGGPKLGQRKPEGPRSTGIMRDSLTFQNFSMPALADYLSQRSGGRPIVDGTKIEGYYDFSAALPDATPDDPISVKKAIGMGTRDGSLARTIAEAIGMRLEDRRGPVEVVVVDRVERLAEN